MTAITYDTARDLVVDLVERAKKAGAQAADARIGVRESLSVDVRLGALEGVEREESRSAALRVIIGKRQAHVSGADLSSAGLAALAERCVAMAKAAPEDPWCGIAGPDELSDRREEIEAETPSVDAPTLEAAAIAMEDAARAVDGVTNSNGSGASWSRSLTHVAASNGFVGARGGARSSLGVSVVAARDGQMERDYASRVVRDWAALPDPQSLGREAGGRTVARLGARKAETGRAAVIFEHRLASRLIGPLLHAIEGPAIARGVSFMKGKVGEQVLPKGVDLIDDPFLEHGLASRPFDGEGRPVTRAKIIDDGVLTGWLLNGPSARQLGLAPNGYASFGFGDPPGVSTSNAWISPGDRDLDGLMAEAGTGLLVTDMFGPSLNPNTGDYSVGVSGFWFEGGARAYPVSEATVASDLLTIYAQLVPGSDLDMHGSVNAPSLLVPDMAIAGR